MDKFFNYNKYMQKFTPLTEIAKKNIFLEKLRSFASNISGFIEIVIILGLWFILFGDTSSLGGFTREEIMAYLLLGNLISIINSYVLYKIINHDLINPNSKMLILKPIKYFFHIIKSGFSKYFLNFLVLIVFDLALIYFLIEDFTFHFDLNYILVILVITILSFVIEFLLAYLTNLYIFWIMDSSDLYKIILRLKKFLSGSYFPLSLLPVLYLNISLLLPFAYSFFVPTQLYLKNIDISAGVFGVLIQIFWIIILYFLIRIVWNKKNKAYITSQNNKLSH